MATPERARSESPVITATELAGRLRSHLAPRMIDVRERDEFAAGHIPGSENVPLSRFSVLFRSLPKQEELVLVCRSGNRSGMAQQFLAARGYARTRNMVGGLLNWAGPVETGE